jgi:hypothetical protein
MSGGESRASHSRPVLISRSCFYSRKSFFFPERQQGPHRNWQQEVSFLDGVFGK